MIIVVICLILAQVNCRVLEERADYLKLQLSRHLLGTYVAQIFIGNPPQQQTLAVDTGSHLLVVKGNQCKNCEATVLPYFDKSSSTSFRDLDCEQQTFKCMQLCPRYQEYDGRCVFQLHYGINAQMSTRKGIYGSDLISFGNYKTNSISFASSIGVDSEESQQNADDYNGLLGVNQFDKFSLMYSWFSAKNISQENMKQGMCFQGKRGYLQWGNLNETRADKTIVKYNYNSKYFKVNVEEITMQTIDLLDKVAMNDYYGVMIDSGASSCIFPTKDYKSIVEIVDFNCENIRSCLKISPTETIHQHCYKLSMSQYADLNDFLNIKFPEIKIKLNGTYFNLKPSSFLKFSGGNNVDFELVCLKMIESLQNKLILGVNWMEDKKFIFNLDPSKETIEIFDNYQCFDYSSEVFSKLASGFTGYLILLSIFIFLCCRNGLLGLRKRFKTKEVNFLSASGDLQ